MKGSKRLVVWGALVTTVAMFVSCPLPDSPLPAEKETVPTPTFSPVASTYTDPQSVTISTTTQGASIRYTTDGSTPTSTVGTLFSEPISVSMNQKINAIAFKTGWADSAIASAEYAIGGMVTTLAGTALTTGSTDGTGSIALFRYPYGITNDGNNLYVADTENHTIRKIVIASGEVTTLAGTPGSAGTTDSTDGTGSTAFFSYPCGITNDGTNLYVADTENHTIRMIVITTGEVTTLAGTAGDAGTTDSTDGTGSTALFDGPEGIIRDGSNLYVADTSNHTIRKVVIATGEVTTLAGTPGSAGTTDSTDGTGSTALFWYPCGIASSGTNLYVADTGNHTIRKIAIATGEVTTLAGTAGTTGSTDSMGNAARFYGPYGITSGGANLYVADTDNLTIRKIVISTGIVTTLAGSAGFSGNGNGTGSAARFYHPCGITSNGTNLYVADTDNHTIRMISW